MILSFEKILFFLCAILNALFFICTPVIAEENQQESVLDRALKSEQENYLTLTVENDMFGGDTDQNYTSGIRLGWFNLKTKPPGLSKQVERFIPFLKTNGTTSTYYSLGQTMFTPEDIGSYTQDPNDRPWAAFLYGSVGMSTLKRGYTDEYELTIGIIGPLALGEQAQKHVHYIIKSKTPNGWDNQLKNELGLMLSWQRRWPKFLSYEANRLGISFMPHFGVTAGNIYIYSNVGGTVRVASNKSLWTDKPFMVRPAMPGTGFFLPSDNIDWELFAGFDGRAIARSIFLDGNTFQDSHRVDKKYFVMDASAGISFVIKSARLSYSLVYRTKEFETQKNESIFGGFSVSYNF